MTNINIKQRISAEDEEEESKNNASEEDSERLDHI